MSQLEKFLFAHTLPEHCITEVGGNRRAILPVFKMGTTDLVDNRKFKMEDDDFATLKQNLANKQTPCPILFEHADGPRGGLGGGKVISLQHKDGEIFAHATLTKRAYAECKDEEWLSCSGGFLAKRDDEGNIRPVELLEVSFTNLPAFPGLSEIQTFSVLTPKEVTPMPEPTNATETQVEVLPTPPPVAPVTLEVTTTEAPASSSVTVTIPVELEVSNIDTTSPSTIPVVDAVAPEPKTEAVALESSNPSVGEVIGAMQQQIDAMNEQIQNLLDVIDRLSNPPAPADMPMAMAAETPAGEEVVELTPEQNAQVMELAIAARTEENRRKDRVEALMAQGEAEGKIVPANREAMEKFANADPDAFKVALTSMKPILTKRSIGDAVIRVDLGLLDMSPEREAEILTKAVQLQVKRPDLSLAELSTIVKKHIV